MEILRKTNLFFVLCAFWGINKKTLNDICRLLFSKLDEEISSIEHTINLLKLLLPTDEKRTRPHYILPTVRQNMNDKISKHLKQLITIAKDLCNSS